MKTINMFAWVTGIAVLILATVIFSICTSCAYPSASQTAPSPGAAEPQPEPSPAIPETDSEKYNRAKELYDTGQYYESSQVFGEILEFSDAKALQEDAQKRMILAPVTLGDEWGYIDNYNNVVIAPRYEDAKPFYNGRALVRTDSAWGLIDPTGAVVQELETSWEAVGPYIDGLACFSQTDERGDVRYGCIDQTGKVIFSAFSLIPIYFIDSYALVDYGKEYYLNIQGDLISKEALASCLKEWVPSGYENELYSTLLPFMFECVAGKCSSSGVELYDEHRNCDDYLQGYLYPDGSFAIIPKYLETREFIDGLAPVRDVSGKWGFVDYLGNYVIKPIYEDALRFSQGLAAVKTDGKYGYIDKNGNMVIQPQFYGATIFREGLAGIKTVDSNYYEGWGFIDQTGNIVIEPKFGEVDGESFMAGYCLVGTETKNVSGDGMKYGVIDKSGKWKISPQSPKNNIVPSVWPGAMLVDFKYISFRGKNESAQYDSILTNHGERTGSYWSQTSGEVERFVFSDNGFIDALTPSDVPAIPDYERPTAVWDMLAQGLLTSPDELEYKMEQISEGLSLFSENLLYGFRDTQGNTVIEAQYKRAGPFGACTDELLSVSMPEAIDFSGSTGTQPVYGVRDGNYVNTGNLYVINGTLDGRDIVILGKLSFSSGIFWKWDSITELPLFSMEGDENDSSTWSVIPTINFPGELKIHSYHLFSEYVREHLPSRELNVSKLTVKELQLLYEQLVHESMRVSLDSRRIDDTVYVVRFRTTRPGKAVMFFAQQLGGNIWCDIISGIQLDVEGSVGEKLLYYDAKAMLFSDYFENVPYEPVMSVSELLDLYVSYVPEEYRIIITESYWNVRENDE